MQNIATNVGEMHDASLDAILSAMNCHRASILLFDEEKVMRFVAWRGLSERYRKAVEGHSPWKPDAKSPKPVCINDVDIADIPKALKSAIRSEGIRAAAFIPLVSSRKLIGKFMTYYDAPHVFTDDELKLATTIATQLAQAIEHKRDEEALRESEARLRATVEQATAGVARCDTNGRIVFANRTLCKMLGYTESELIGKSVAEVTYRDDVKKTMRLFQRMIQLGKPFELEKRYVRKDGSVLWADVSASPVREPNGKAQSTVAVVVDITARKKVEQALQKSNEALEQLVDQRTKALSVANAELKGEIERRKGLEGEILSVSDRESRVGKFPKFKAVSRKLKLAPGVGLPGRIWRNLKPAWVSDITKDTNFPRASVAAREGLHGTFAFPISFGKHFIGVMEFFSLEIREPDDDLLKIFSSIGSQMGQFVQRKRAEAALQKSKELLEQLVRQRTKALRVANAELKNEIARRKGLEGEILSVSRPGATAVGPGIT